MKSRKPVDLTSWKKSWLRRSQVDATAPPRTQKGDDVCPMSAVLWTKQWESPIDHFNDIKKATKFILGLDPDKTAISVNTRAEVLTGFEDNEARHAKALLDQFLLLLIEKETADKAAELRKTHGWKLPDAFQAALCMEHHIKLTTRNTKRLSLLGVFPCHFFFEYYGLDTPKEFSIL